LLLHVSALAGHLQAEYTIIFGKFGKCIPPEWSARAETCSGEININKHLKKVVVNGGSSNNLDKERATGCRTLKEKF
jgi:hypothetical protein